MKPQDLDTIQATMRDQGIPPATINAVMADLAKAIAEEKAAKDTTPKAKSQFVVLLDDAEDRFKGQAFLGWIMTIENDAPPQVAQDRAKAAGRAFNESKKGSRKPVKDLRETFAGVPTKFWNDGVEGHKTARKVKEPVLIQPVKGSLT